MNIDLLELFSAKTIAWSFIFSHIDSESKDYKWR